MKLYNIRGICGLNECPCGRIYTGKDQRTRDLLKRLRITKSELGAQADTNLVNVPDIFFINSNIANKYKEHVIRNQYGKGTVPYDIRSDDKTQS